MKDDTVIIGTCNMLVKAKLETIVDKPSPFNIQHLVLEFSNGIDTAGVISVKIFGTNRREVKRLAKLISQVADEFHD